jgi:hypothetical protein
MAILLESSAHLHSLSLRVDVYLVEEYDRAAAVLCDQAKISTF